MYIQILYYLCLHLKKEAKYCQCLYFTANALARNIGKIADEEFARTGLAPSYAFLLMTVNDEPGIQPGEIAAIMELKPSTVTRLIEKMEAKKMLERKTEGRHTKVYPTAKSKAINKEIHEAWNNLYKRYVKILGEKRSKDVTSAIHDVSMKLSE